MNKRKLVASAVLLIACVGRSRAQEKELGLPTADPICSAILSGQSAPVDEVAWCRAREAKKNAQASSIETASLMRRSPTDSNDGTAAALPDAPEVGQAVPVSAAADSPAPDKGNGPVVSHVEKHSVGFVAGKIIKSPSGSGYGGAAFFDLYHTHGLFFQPTIGLFETSGTQKVVQQSPPEICPLGTIVQRTVANVPSTWMVPVFHTSYAPKEFFHRVRPAVGVAAVIARVPKDTPLNQELVLTNPAGKVHIEDMQPAGTLPTQGTRFGPAITGGISIRLKGRTHLDALCAASPESQGSKRTSACMAGIRW